MLTLKKEKKTLALQALRDAKDAVDFKRRTLSSAFRKAMNYRLSKKQFEATEKELTKVLIPFFVEQGRSMTKRLEGMGGKNVEELMEKHGDHDQSTHGRGGGGGDGGIDEALSKLNALPVQNGWVDNKDIFTEVEDGEPYEDISGYREEDIKTETVSIDKLVSTQSVMEKATIEKYIHDPDKPSDIGDVGKDKPFVVKAGNRYFVHDGHHRVAAMKLLGRTEVEINVLSGRIRRDDDDEWDDDEWDDETVHHPQTKSLPPSDPAAKLVKKIFDPKEWQEDLTNRLLPVLARRMGEAAVAHLMTLGIDPRSRKGVKASTAAEWAEENLEDWATLEEAFRASGQSIGILNELPQWMKDNIAERLNESFSQDYWASVSETTMGNAETVLRAGIAEGQSIRDMAVQLREYFEDGGFRYARARSENIARTESANALNGARKDSVAQLQRELGDKVPIKQTWLSALGNTTRATHAELDGVPENKNGMWDLSGYEIPWPGHIDLPANERCNCQCSLTIEFGMQEDEAQQLIDDYWSRVEELGKGTTLLDLWRKHGDHDQLKQGCKSEGES